MLGGLQEVRDLLGSGSCVRVSVHHCALPSSQGAGFGFAAGHRAVRIPGPHRIPEAQPRLRGPWARA